jgi:hypothetical protein
MRIKHINMNMTELELQDGTLVLFSYQTPVASFRDGKFYKTSRSWSKTTSRHINKWIAGHVDQCYLEQQEYFDNLVKGL